MAENASTDAPTNAAEDAGDGTQENSDRTYTQDDFNREIGRRLKAQREQFANYDEYKRAAEQLAEIEKASKTELEIVSGKYEETNSKLSSATAENLRLRVALDKSLPADLVDRLRGDTREEIEADADKLLELVKPAPSGFDGGARTAAPAGSDMNRLLRQAAGRQ